jgi:hypothetical protein
MAPPPSRRTVLRGLALLPVLAATAAAGNLVLRGAGRPAAEGTSATRCGLCGGRDHAMLACPSARGVL